MNLSEVTRALLSRGEKGLVPFLTAGYPDPDTFLQLLETAAAAGSDVIEIGVPFSDPIADGPIIQAASQAVLAQGMSLRKTLALARQAAASIDTPLVLMGYVNPILRMGREKFAEAAGEAGISGVIVPDVPHEESGELRQRLAGCGITLIDLLAPTSGPERVSRIAGSADGFLYLVSVTGVTGVRSARERDLGAFVARVRQRTDLPLYVGFGVSDREQAVQTVRHADGVIIGSALIRLIQAAPDGAAAVTRIENFLSDIKQAITCEQRSES